MQVASEKANEVRFVGRGDVPPAEGCWILVAGLCMMTNDYKRLRMKNSVLAGNFWNSNQILLKFLVNLPFIYVPHGNIIVTLGVSS